VVLVLFDKMNFETKHIWKKKHIKKRVYYTISKVKFLRTLLNFILSL